MNSLAAPSPMSSGINLQTTMLIVLFGSSLLHFSSGYDETTQYMGCFMEKGADQGFNSSYRVLNHQIPITAVTIQSCIDHCRMDLFTFAGLQNGNACFCGNQYYGKKAFDCSRPCSGNGEEKCGGDWQISLYSVCGKGMYGTICNETCSCNGKGKSQRCYVSSGNCIPNMNECLDKDINSTCKRATCNDTDTGYECICDRGYKMSKTYGKCSAINGIPPYAVCMVFIAIVTPISIAINLVLMQLHKWSEKKEEEKKALRAEQTRREEEERGYVNPAHDVNANESDVQPHLYKKLHQRPISHTDA